MKKMARIAAAAILTLGASAVTTSTATAGLSNATITSDPATSRRHLGSFAGTASYDDATHKLTVHLNNTSASGRGFLTGFAFNTKGGAAKYLDGDNLATRGKRIRPPGASGG